MRRDAAGRRALGPVPRVPVARRVRGRRPDCVAGRHRCHCPAQPRAAKPPPKRSAAVPSRSTPTKGRGRKFRTTRAHHGCCGWGTPALRQRRGATLEWHGGAPDSVPARCRQGYVASECGAPCVRREATPEPPAPAPALSRRSATEIRVGGDPWTQVHGYRHPVAPRRPKTERRPGANQFFFEQPAEQRVSVLSVGKGGAGHSEHPIPPPRYGSSPK